MKLEERSVTLRDGTRALLRSPEICDAERLNAYLRLTSAETHFMVRYPEECNQTLETAQKRLQAMLDSERSFMLAAFIDGELVGNCGVNEIADRLKMRHRASLGISIKKKAWGLGLGTILISRALEQAKENGLRRWNWACLPITSAPSIFTGSSALPRWAASQRHFCSKTARTATRRRW